MDVYSLCLPRFIVLPIAVLGQGFYLTKISSYLIDFIVFCEIDNRYLYLLSECDRESLSFSWVKMEKFSLRDDHVMKWWLNCL